MKKFMAFIAVLMFCSVLSSASAQEPEVTLSIGHFISPLATIPVEFIEPWAEKITEESNGRIAFEIFPGAQLASPPGTYDAIKDGVMDIGWSLPGYTPGRFPIAEVLEMPFAAGSGTATSQAAWDIYDTYLRDEFSDVHMLAFHVHGPGLFHMKGDPVTSLEDLRGKAIRAPTRPINKALALLGAEPISMPVPGVPEAISRGVVDGTVLPFEITVSLKLAELVDSHTQFEGDRAMYTSVFFFAMNKDVYEGMPDDLKAILDANSGMFASEWAGRVMDEGDTPGLEVAQAEGNDFYTFTEEEKLKWQAITQPVIDEWIEVANSAGLDGAAILQEAQDLITKYESENE